MKTIFLSIAISLLFTSVLNAQKKETLTNKSVVDLYKAGLSTETIITKIESADAKFDVSTTGMIALKKQNLPDDIINAMVKKSDAGAGAGSTEAATKTMAKPTTTVSKMVATPDLDFINVPHYLAKPQNKLLALERSTVAVKAKVNILKAMVPGTSTPIVFKMDSAFSPVRLPLQESSSFMINTGNNVPEIFGLYKMKPDKKKREAVWFNVSAFQNTSDKDVIAFNYKKVKDGVYELVPVSKLEKGEYCFVNKASYGTYGGAKADVFAFGVD